MLSSGNPAIRLTNGPVDFRPRIAPGLALRRQTRLSIAWQWTLGFPSHGYPWFGLLKATRPSTLLQVDPWLSVPGLLLVWRFLSFLYRM
jgi:hypothetical protein